MQYKLGSERPFHGHVSQAAHLLELWFVTNDLKQKKCKTQN